MPKALPLSLLGSALTNRRSIYGAPGTGSIRHGGNFWQLVRATPIGLTKKKGRPITMQMQSGKRLLRSNEKNGLPKGERCIMNFFLVSPQEYTKMSMLS